ncbi:hypothetical protein [Vibrio vulnificus YJ016]|uniref:Uncharacterized protein n=1 Tax=Vibrio vulnificus (strain YJ016) TaxID=196600 RepID=Q7MBW7_VIBVY|nr:hypothetical protein [Vibrio vulnificus YJ016]
MTFGNHFKKGKSSDSWRCFTARITIPLTTVDFKWEDDGVLLTKKRRLLTVKQWPLTPLVGPHKTPLLRCLAGSRGMLKSG